MSKETDSLQIIEIQWRHKKPDQTIASTENPHQVRTYIERMYVRCKHCLHEWLAFPGNRPGYFEEAAGLVCIYCPSCGRDNNISRDLIE